MGKMLKEGLANAIMEGNAAKVKSFVGKVDFNEVLIEDITPLGLAIDYRGNKDNMANIDVLNALVAGGADVTKPVHKSGVTAEFLATRNEDTRALWFLEKHTMEVNKQLANAIMEGDAAKVKSFVGKVDFNEVLIEGHTPLGVAIDYIGNKDNMANIDVLNALVAGGADVTKPVHKSGVTAEFLATRNEDTRALKFLEKQGATTGKIGLKNLGHTRVPSDGALIESRDALDNAEHDKASELKSKGTAKSRGNDLSGPR